MQCYLPSISHLASLDLVCHLLCTSVMPLLYHWYICTCKQLVWGKGFQHHSGKLNRKPSSQPGRTCYLAQHHHCTEKYLVILPFKTTCVCWKRNILKKDCIFPRQSPCIHTSFTLKVNSQRVLYTKVRRLKKYNAITPYFLSISCEPITSVLSKLELVDLH